MTERMVMTALVVAITAIAVSDTAAGMLFRIALVTPLMWSGLVTQEQAEAFAL